MVVQLEPGKPGTRGLISCKPLRVQPDQVIQPPDLLTVFVVEEGSKPCGMLIRRETVVEAGDSGEFQGDV
jgi:hypothetical protein